MIVTINAKKLATELADAKVSFKTHNKVFKELGRVPAKEDLRTSNEWTELYNTFYKSIIDQAHIK